ncbi:MAG TPA: HEAT repeat domain-containing protein [Cellvibrio sp.]
MSIQTDFKKHLLLPALIGATITYGTLTLIDDDSLQREQVSALENRILDLELLLAQKEDELADARFFSAGVFGAADPSAQSGSGVTNHAPATVNAQPEPARSELANNAASPDSQQLLKDLSTLSDRDPRSFSEKANALLAGNAGKENIALVSKGVFDLADNRDILPDYELESLYQSQTNPDLQRVIAQVMSTRGDNRLLEKQITKAQTNLSSDNPAIRQQALVELGKTRYASAANAIAPLLQDSDTNVKLDALLALRATGNQSHVRLAETLVNHPDPAVSWLAKDVVNSLQNLSERARTQLASTDIVAELPVIAVP